MAVFSMKKLTSVFVFVLYFIMLICFITTLSTDKINVAAVIAAVVSLLGYGLTVFWKKIPEIAEAFAAAVLYMVCSAIYVHITDSFTASGGIFLMVMCVLSLYGKVSVNIAATGIMTAYHLLYFLVFDKQFFSHMSPTEMFIMFAPYVGSFIIIALIRFNDKMAELSEKKAKEAAAAAQAKTDFLANMSHEIRTPMNAIYGMAELLANSDTSPQHREYIKVIRNSSENLISIINDVLDFSKIEAGKMDIVEVPYSVKSIADNVESIVAPRAAQKNIALIVSVEPTIPSELVGDEVKIRQILLNLLNNAVKFTERGRIKLSISMEMGKYLDSSKVKLVFAVSDTGIGIKPEDLQKLFSTFSQVDTKRNRNIEGTGLGLSISMNLARMMNGTITVESEYGAGSTFYFTVEQVVSNNTPTAYIQPQLRKSMSVYIFEPNIFLRDDMEKDCHALGIEPKFVENIRSIHNEMGQEKAILIFDYAEGIIRYENIKAQFPNVIPIAAVGMNEVFDEEKYPYLRYFIKPITVYSIAEMFVSPQKTEEKPEQDNEIKMFCAPEARIMIVDDNVTNLQVAESLIKPYNTEIVCAHSGNEAIRIFRGEKKFDLIFMDHMMPQLDGVDTVKFIRSLGTDYAKNVPIVALTANVVKGVEELFYSAGMNDFIPKPIDINKLHNVMKKWIPGEKQVDFEEVPDDYDSSDIDCNDIFPKKSKIDYRRGIESVYNKPKAYIGILKSFVTLDAPMVLERALKERDIKNYTITVHGVKSAAANIGAEELSEEARLLEVAGKNGNYDYIYHEHEKFLRDYKMIIEEISGVIARYEGVMFDDGGKNYTHAETEAMLNSLLEAVKNMDAASSEEITDNLRGADLGNAAEYVEKAIRYISGYDFDEAEESIVKAIEKFHKIN